MLFFSTRCRRTLLGAALSLPLGTLPVAAQSALAPAGRPQPREYMTLTVIESTKQEFAKILLAPSFHASSQAYLEGYDSATETGNSWAYGRNQERLTKQLNELAAEDWEVVEVHPAPYLPAGETYSTRYLLQRARR